MSKMNTKTIQLSEIGKNLTQLSFKKIQMKYLYKKIVEVKQKLNKQPNTCACGRRHTGARGKTRVRHGFQYAVGAELQSRYAEIVKQCEIKEKGLCEHRTALVWLQLTSLAPYTVKNYQSIQTPSH